MQNLSPTLFFFAAAGFIIGSIPIGFIVSKALLGTDIRQHGSGNVGATNVYRTLGKRAGLITLLGDMLKGIVAVMLASVIENSNGLELGGAVLGFFAILGHCFSPFLKFKGGKGVATSLGVFICLAPLETLIACLVFAAVFVCFRYVSLASILSAVVLPGLVWALSGDIWIQVAAFGTAILVIAKHRQNIQRLLNGSELRIQAKTAKQNNA